MHETKSAGKGKVQQNTEQNKMSKKSKNTKTIMKSNSKITKYLQTRIYEQTSVTMNCSERARKL